MKPFVIAAVLLIACKTSAAPPLLTQSEALRIALENNFGILVAENEAQRASLENSPGNAGMLPVASITGTEKYTITEPPLGFASPASQKRRTNALSATAKLDWTLFDGGMMFVVRKKLREIEELGAIAYKEKVMQTSFAVIAAYYNIVRQKQQLVFIDETIRYDRERVTIARTGFDAGLAQKTTLLQATVDLNVNRQKRIEQLNVIASARRELNQLLCRDLSTLFEVGDSISFGDPPGRDYLLGKVEEENTSIRTLDKQLEIAALAIRENRSLLLPEFSLSTGYGFSSNLYSSGSTADNKAFGPQLGAALSIPLFQGGNALRRLESSRLQLESAAWNLEETKLRVRADLENLLDDFECQRTLLEIERENIGLAKDNLDICMQRLRLGESTSLELRQAEESYENSHTRLLAIEYNLMIVQTRLKLLAALL